MSPESPARPETNFADRIVHAVAGPPGWLDSARVTRAILWLNAFVFTGEVVRAARHGGLALAGVPRDVLLAFGANYAPATVYEHRTEALVASCFVHGSLFHLGFNMLALRNVGPLVESEAGAARFAPLYLAAGIAGSLASAVTGVVQGAGRVSVGASGAILGVMGAALVVGVRTQGIRGPLAQTMLRWILFTIVLGAVAGSAQSGIDNAAHLGGLAVGIAGAALWSRTYVYTPRRRQVVLSACSAVLVATAVTVFARDWVSPYSTMVLEQRDEAARTALEEGRCADARRAQRAAARLSSDGLGDPLTVAIGRLIEQRCGSPERSRARESTAP